jgi:hypothetical protein
MAVVMLLVMLVSSVAAVIVRPPTVVICPVIRISTVIAVIAARIVSISVPWIAVITVPVTGVTESDSDASDPNRDLSVSLFYRHKSQSDRYQWK